jgi:RNA polymerase sigma-70 factor (ECF subfamily)
MAAGSGSAGSEQALERLCRAYWYPLYAYVRRIGEDAENARDLTQGFFARLLEKNYLGQVQPAKGKFRSFLLASLKHYLSDERDKARAQKRGGGARFLSLDDSSLEERYRLEPIDALDAEKLFERRWALSLLREARDLLRQEFADRAQSELYDQLKIFDSGDPAAPSYAEVALKLDLAEGSVKSAVSRMRTRYRELVRQAVAATVADPDEIDDEIRYLISIISA